MNINECLSNYIQKLNEAKITDPTDLVIYVDEDAYAGIGRVKNKISMLANGQDYNLYTVGYGTTSDTTYYTLAKDISERCSNASKVYVFISFGEIENILKDLKNQKTNINNITFIDPFNMSMEPYELNNDELDEKSQGIGAYRWRTNYGHLEFEAPNEDYAAQVYQYGRNQYRAEVGKYIPGKSFEQMFIKTFNSIEEAKTYAEDKVNKLYTGAITKAEPTLEDFSWQENDAFRYITKFVSPISSLFGVIVIAEQSRGHDIKYIVTIEDGYKTYEHKLFSDIEEAKKYVEKTIDELLKKNPGNYSLPVVE